MPGVSAEAADILLSGTYTQPSAIPALQAVQVRAAEVCEGLQCGILKLSASVSIFRRTCTVRLQLK